MGTLRC